VAAAIENHLAPGRYRIDFWMMRNRQFSDVVIYLEDVASFVVYGGGGVTRGLLSLPARVRAVPAEPSATEEGR
jgi:hypothetical protein